MTTSHLAQHALKDRLVRTWPAFFSHHGTFTETQVNAIPLLLDGSNVILCAPTASGKTSAVIAPLVERYCPPTKASRPGPIILYIVPTRALVNDLVSRLTGPLELLGLSIGSKTRDVGTFRPDRPQPVLLTTPESLDSLLCTRPRSLIAVQAVVLDELHQLDGTPRGDHLRVLLNRLRHIRAHAYASQDTTSATIQYAALSATLKEPLAVAARYFPNAHVAWGGASRRIDYEEVAIAREGATDLNVYLTAVRQRGWHKTLIFCNSRAEVESYAAATHIHAAPGLPVLVHYSNIYARRRRDVEQRFAAASDAILFTTNTLELGIDIGDIDGVILIGPPGSHASFIQRVGRGNRRRDITRVACLYRTPLEHLIFDTLHSDDSTEESTDITRDDGSAASFRFSIVVQQLFSLMKGSPTAALRLPSLAPIFSGLLSYDNLFEIVGHLVELDYLVPGRSGEWKAGKRLNDLIDRQGYATEPLSIYSNIQGLTGRPISVRDQHTHDVIATVDHQWLDQGVVTVEGRLVTVEWDDGDAMWVAPYRGRDAANRLIYRSTRQLLSYDVARGLAPRLGFAAGSAPYIVRDDGLLCFHFLGDLYGQAVLGLLSTQSGATATSEPGLCLSLPHPAVTSFGQREEAVRSYLNTHFRRFEKLLDLGPFQQFLPERLRKGSVTAAFDVPQFISIMERLILVRADDARASRLLSLLDG